MYLYKAIFSKIKWSNFISSPSRCYEAILPNPNPPNVIIRPCKWFHLYQFTWWHQAVEFLFCSYICCWACTQPPDQPKKDRNQKFGDTLPYIILSKNIFFDKVTVGLASLEKLPHHDGISSIALFGYQEKKILTSGDLLFIHWTGFEWFLLILVMVSLYSYSSYASGIWWNG